jgi:hypothetical protein
MVGFSVRAFQSLFTIYYSLFTIYIFITIRPNKIGR